MAEEFLWDTASKQWIPNPQMCQKDVRGECINPLSLIEKHITHQHPTPYVYINPYPDKAIMAGRSKPWGPIKRTTLREAKILSEELDPSGHIIIKAKKDDGYIITLRIKPDKISPVKSHFKDEDVSNNFARLNRGEKSVLRGLKKVYRGSKVIYEIPEPKGKDEKEEEE